MSSLPASMKKILSKNRGARVFRTLYINFSDAQGKITRVSGGIWPKFELIQAFMHVLVTCKNEDDRLKNEGARVFTIITLWELSVAMDTRVPIRSGPKPNAAFLNPNDGSDLISL